MKNKISVSCGILSKENKYLLVQRPSQSSNALRWEFPGGKIDKGETAEDCLVRELIEELAIVVKIDNKLDSICIERSDFILELIPFECHIIKGKITLLEHLDMQWLNAPLPQLDICEGDLLIFKQLQNK